MCLTCERHIYFIRCFRCHLIICFEFFKHKTLGIFMDLKFSSKQRNIFIFLCTKEQFANISLQSKQTAWSFFITSTCKSKRRVTSIIFTFFLLTYIRNQMMLTSEDLVLQNRKLMTVRISEYLCL